MGCGALASLSHTHTDAAAVELGTTTTALPRETASPSQPQSKTIPYVIIGVIVAILVFIALIIDVSCYFVNKKGKTFVFFSFIFSILKE